MVSDWRELDDPPPLLRREGRTLLGLHDAESRNRRARVQQELGHVQLRAGGLRTDQSKQRKAGSGGKEDSPWWHTSHTAFFLLCCVVCATRGNWEKASPSTRIRKGTVETSPGPACVQELRCFLKKPQNKCGSSCGKSSNATKALLGMGIHLLPFPNVKWTSLIAW